MMLQQVGNMEEVPADARQMAVIYMKNSIRRYWADPKEGEPTNKRMVVFRQEDKYLVKQGIVDVFPRAASAVRAQLEECLRGIIAEDVPTRWPELITQVMNWLAGGNQQEITAALRVMRIVAKKYEYRDDDDRVELEAIVDAVFPQLMATFLSLLESRASDSLDLAELLKLCCKVYYSTTYMGVPQLLMNDQAQYEGWMNGFLALAEMRPHVQGMPEDAEGRRTWPWWKMKKWLYNIAYRLFSKYGVARVGSATKSVDEAFGAKWNSDYSMKFLHAVVHELSFFSQGAYITPRVANILLNFLDEAIHRPVYWKEIEPHITQIVQQVVVPMLAFNDADQELWDEDPEEYIRKGYDIIEDIYSPKTAAVTVICQLCSSKKKKQLDPIMNFLASILQEYHAAGQSVSQPLARRLDGAIYAVGSLADVLRKNKTYLTMIPGIFQTYIIPLFTSPYGHLRSKACWVSSSFAQVLYSADDQAKHQLYMQLFEKIQASLGDQDLPVQVDAAVALREFFDSIEDEDAQHFIQALPSLLHKFLELANNVDSEGIMATIESVVERFGDHIGPYAHGVASALVQQFWRIVGNEESDGPTDISDSLAGHSVLATIVTVLEAVSKSPEILAEMETLLFPILEQCLCEEGMDIIEELLEIITYITYYSPSISQRMWSLYPRILDIMPTWGTDFFQDFVPVIDNYISRGLHVFIHSTEPSFLALTNAMLEKSFNQESDGFGTDEEVYVGCAAIIQVILENCRGMVDQCIRTCFIPFKLLMFNLTTLTYISCVKYISADPYMTIIVSIMLKSTGDHTFEDPLVLDNLLVAGADALYYNPVLTMSALQQNGHLAYFMQSLGDSVTKRRKRSGKLYHFASKRFKKTVLLGLASVIATPVDAMPQGIGQSIPQIAAAATRMIIDLKKQEESRPQSSEQPSGQDISSQDYLSDSEEDEEDDDSNDLLNKLRRLRGVRMGSAGYEEDDEDEVDFDYFDDSDDDEDIKSPLDDISPYTVFREACLHLRSNNAELFMSAVQLLDDDSKSALEQLMNTIQ